MSYQSTWEVVQGAMEADNCINNRIPSRPQSFSMLKGDEITWKEDVPRPELQRPKYILSLYSKTSTVLASV